MARFDIFRLERAPHTARLVAPQPLTPADFDAVAAALGEAPQRVRKIGFVAAQLTVERRTIITRWNGKETSAVAEPGDWIATNMNPDRQVLRDADGQLNVYVIPASRFAALYARDDGSTSHGGIYRSLAIVQALYFGDGLDIVAPWGETQRVASGYLLNNGHEVYGNAKQTFEATYLVVP